MESTTHFSNDLTAVVGFVAAQLVRDDSPLTITIERGEFVDYSVTVATVDSSGSPTTQEDSVGLRCTWSKVGEAPIQETLS